MDRDPTRIRDDVAPESAFLREVLERGDDFDPSEAELEKLESRLAPLLLAPPTGPATPDAAPSGPSAPPVSPAGSAISAGASVGSAISTKVVATLVAAVALGGAGTAIWSGVRDDAGDHERPDRAVVETVDTPAQRSEQVPLATLDDASDGAEAQLEPPEPSSLSALTLTPPGSELTPAPEEGAARPRRAGASAPPSSVPSSEQPPSLPSHPAGSAATPSAPREPRAPTSSAGVDSPVRRAPPPRSVLGAERVVSSNESNAHAAPGDEALLLRRAHRALQAGDPAGALALTETHRRLPDARLSQERERIAIESLLRLGRRDAALARAERFRARYPRSLYLQRIDSLLGERE